MVDSMNELERRSMLRTIAAILLLAGSASGIDPDRKISAGWIYDTLPQIADGGYWKTTIILTNLEDRAVSWTVKFFSDDGAPKEFSLRDRGKSTIFSGVLQKDGSVVLETPGLGALNQGWAEVSSSSGDDIGSMVIFGTTGVPSQPDYEASVPGVFSLDDDVVIPYDNTSGFVTSLAVLNSSTYADTILNVRVLDENGSVLKSEILTVKLGHKMAFATTDRWVESRNRRGTIAMKSDTLSHASSVAFRFNPRGPFTTIFPMSK
jgi:hypothetical protein